MVAEINFAEGSNGTQGTIQLYNPPEVGYTEAIWTPGTLGAKQAPDGSGYRYPMQVYDGSNPPRLLHTLDAVTVGDVQRVQKTVMLPDEGRRVGIWEGDQWSGDVKEYKIGEFGDEELIKTTTYGQDGQAQTVLTHSHEYEYNAAGERTGKKQTTQNSNGVTLEAAHYDVDGHLQTKLQYDDKGAFINASVFDENNVKSATFDPRFDPPITGIDFGSPPVSTMSRTDVDDFYRLGNQLRLSGVEEFVDHAASTKYMSLISVIDTTAVAGFPIDMLDRVSLDAPEDIIFNKAAFRDWLGSLHNLPEGTVSQIQVLKMERYLGQLDKAGRNLSANKASQWFFMDALDGRHNPGSLSKRMMAFSEQMPNSKILGQSPATFADTICDGALSNFPLQKLSKMLGVIGNVGLLGIDFVTSITATAQTIEQLKAGAETPEALMYQFFLTAGAFTPHSGVAMGAALGAGIFAALDSHQKGGDAESIAAAFFWGLAGFYDPSSPHGSFGETLRETKQYMDQLKRIDIPPGTNHKGEPHNGFNWEAAYDKHFQELRAAGVETYVFAGSVETSAAQMDDPAHDGALQLAETEFYEFLRDNIPEESDAYGIQISCVNGDYVELDADNNVTDNPDEAVYKAWVWFPHETPKIRIRDDGPITSLEALSERLYFEGFVGTEQFDPYEMPEVESAIDNMEFDWLEDGSDDDNYQYFPVGSGWCWVARAVYGGHNPKWLAFREWVLTESPAWFKYGYGLFGPAVADFVKNKPWLKRVIRRWMDSKIEAYRA